MKTIKQLYVLGVVLVTSQAAFAADSVGNAAASLNHSGKAIKHAAIASGQVVSGVAAVPLIVVGEVGKASGKAGEALMNVATDSEPLEVTEMNLTAEPAPSVVMKDAAQTNQR